MPQLHKHFNTVRAHNMELWRIINKKFIESAFSGRGTKMVGGSWNSKGTPIVYSASSKAAAIVEFLSLTPDMQFEFIIKNFLFVRIHVPDKVSKIRKELSQLPKKWTTDREITQNIGTDWYEKCESCLLEVPSYLVPGDSIFLIHNEHPDFELLNVSDPEDYNCYAAYEKDELIKKKLFLCHAFEDKAEIVRPLRDELFKIGVSCWLDEAEITLGDSITEMVNKGLMQSSFVIVVISPSFMQKSWPKRELYSAINREAREGIKVILPILVDYENTTINFPELLPLIEDKLYYKWDNNPANAAFHISKSIK